MLAMGLDGSSAAGGDGVVGPDDEDDGGVVEVFVDFVHRAGSFRNATVEPVKVTAPMKTR
ncbi:hypothetical protein QFZ79_003965 [Arthrobacter sp. V4I6]|nr:hypothetical protein [Arthrobacter sp. V1I7]MDQ0855854.1 hypothetical protein [Arthrobacter sp. V4I6]